MHGKMLAAAPRFDWAANVSYTVADATAKLQALVNGSGNAYTTEVAGELNSPFLGLNYTVVTEQVAGELTVHAALVARIKAHFRRVANVGEALEVLTFGELVHDFSNVPQLEEAIVPMFRTTQGVVSEVNAFTSEKNSMYVFRHVASPSERSNLSLPVDVEVRWPYPNANLPDRTYDIDAERFSAVPRAYTESSAYGQTPTTHSNIALLRQSFTGGSHLGSYVLIGPQLDAERNMTHYMSTVSCVEWPNKTVALNPRTAVDSCIRVDYATSELTEALEQITSVSFGTVLVILSDGTILAGAGGGLDSSAIVGKQISSIMPAFASYSLKLLLARERIEQSGSNYVIADRLTSPLRDKDGNFLMVVAVVDKGIASSDRRTTTMIAIDGVVLLVMIFFIGHCVHFFYHIKSLNRVAYLMEAAAELQTEEVSDDALDTRHVNKDIESMLTSAAQLFRMMQRIKTHLPDAILRPAGATAPNARADMLGVNPGGDAATPNAANRRGSDAVAVLSDLTSERAVSMERRSMCVVTVVFPNMAAFTDARMSRIGDIAKTMRGTVWAMDDRLNLHLYWEGDALSFAVEAAKALAFEVASEAAGEPIGVVLCRAEATFGIVGGNDSKSFVFGGPVVDATRAMAAMLRRIRRTVCMELPTAASAAAPAVRRAVLLVDNATLTRIDPTSVRQAVFRTVGAVPVAQPPGFCDSMADVARGPASYLDAAALRPDREHEHYLVKEALVQPPSAPALTEQQRLLWAAVGDVTTAVLRRNMDEARKLLAVVGKHREDGLGGDGTDGEWESHVLFTLHAATELREAVADL
jgi:hypothetical protein